MRFPRLDLRTAIASALLIAGNLYAIHAMRAPEPEPLELPAVSVEASRPVTDTAPTVVAELTEQVAKKPNRKPDAPADLVVLVSVDGLRHDAVYPHARNVHRLGLQGAQAMNARTISKSSTLPSHASMVSGVDVDRHGLAFNAYRPERGHIQYPTIFSAAQQAGLSTGVFVGKRKLEHLLDPENVVHFEVGGVFCSKVTKLAVPHLQSAGPGVMFVHFSDPDGAGHRHGWESPEYAKAVRRADRCVLQIMQAVDERPDRDRVMVLVTSDHGGHSHNHGSRRKLDRHIPWILWGKAAKKTRVKRTVFNTDTAATIFYALGLEPPQEILGRPVLEAFQ